MRNDVKVLFGDIIAEQTGKGTYVVRKGEKMVAPFEYTEIRKLTPKCWALRRADFVITHSKREYAFLSIP
jgi:hypothetical protein